MIGIIIILYTLYMMYLSYISAQLYIEAAVVGHSGEAGHLTSAASWC
jgi:hypothetical protein